jgi:hypothetical protein
MIKSRRMILAGHVARIGKQRNRYRILMGKPEGKRSIARPECRWEDNIKMDLRKIEWDGMDWINLTWDKNMWRALLVTSINLPVS